MPSSSFRRHDARLVRGSGFHGSPDPLRPGGGYLMLLSAALNTSRKAVPTNVKDRNRFPFLRKRHHYTAPRRGMQAGIRNLKFRVGFMHPNAHRPIHPQDSRHSCNACQIPHHASIRKSAIYRIGQVLHRTYTQFVRRMPQSHVRTSSQEDSCLPSYLLASNEPQRL